VLGCDAVSAIRRRARAAVPGLLGQVGAERPRRVVDLGCGPGNLTALLARRWPRPRSWAWNNSPEMIEAARALALPGVSFSSRRAGLASRGRPGRDYLQRGGSSGTRPSRPGRGWASLLAPGAGSPSSCRGFRIAEPTRSSRSSPARRAGERCSRTCDLTGRPRSGDVRELLLRPGRRVNAWKPRMCIFSPETIPCLSGPRHGAAPGDGGAG